MWRSLVRLRLPVRWGGCDVGLNISPGGSRGGTLLRRSSALFFPAFVFFFLPTTFYIVSLVLFYMWMCATYCAIAMLMLTECSPTFNWNSCDSTCVYWQILCKMFITIHYLFSRSREGFIDQWDNFFVKVTLVVRSSPLFTFNFFWRFQKM